MYITANSVFRTSTFFHASFSLPMDRPLAKDPAQEIEYLVGVGRKRWKKTDPWNRGRAIQESQRYETSVLVKKNISVSMYTCACVYIHIHTYMCMYIYTHDKSLRFFKEALILGRNTEIVTLKCFVFYNNENTDIKFKF